MVDVGRINALKMVRLNGLRYHTDLAYVCIECYSDNVHHTSGTESFVVCRNCRKGWYVNHCWNCEGPIDSRDPKIERCPTCNWSICAECNSCHAGCQRNQDPQRLFLRELLNHPATPSCMMCGNSCDNSGVCDECYESLRDQFDRD